MKQHCRIIQICTSPDLDALEHFQRLSIVSRQQTAVSPTQHATSCSMSCGFKYAQGFLIMKLPQGKGPDI